jgi:hypothetical protein
MEDKISLSSNFSGQEITSGKTTSESPIGSSNSNQDAEGSFSGHAISQTTPNSSKKNVRWSPTKEIKDKNNNITHEPMDIIHVLPMDITHVLMEKKENIKETRQPSWSPSQEIKDKNDNITHVHMEEKKI